jgi:CheY-like chemotaxis protein
MGITVLLVDDQPDTVAHLTRVLACGSCTVLVAESGPQVLALVLNQQPDLVLIDLLFHDTDAFAVCEELRRYPDTASIPVIVMTGLATEMSLTPAHAARAEAFLSKPCDPIELLLTIKRVLRDRSFAFPDRVPSPPCLQESS